MMLTVILAGALAITAAQQQTDTTFDVRDGGRVTIDGMNGSVRVGTWDRAAMRIRAQHDSRTYIDIKHSSAGYVIEAESRRGSAGSVAYEITVPRNFSVDVDAVNMPTTVEELTGDVRIDNVQGSIIVRGVTGAVRAESVMGGITIERVRGDVNLESVNQALQLTAVRGNVVAEATNGSIVMRGIEADRVEANTVNGLIDYNGTIRDNGRYRFGTHNGSITLAVPEQTNATIRIESQNGKIEAGFPVYVRGGDTRDFTITIGSGSARVDLESFNGTVNLKRP